MLVSPINSIAGQLHLLEATQCKIFLTAKDFPPFKAVATAISAQREMRFVDVESQSYWLSDNRVEIYSFEATLEENPHRPFVIIHTSGSTGEFYSLLSVIECSPIRIAQTDHAYFRSSVRYPPLDFTEGLVAQRATDYL